jgi:hypothetical protein
MPAVWREVTKNDERRIVVLGEFAGIVAVRRNGMNLAIVGHRSAKHAGAVCPFLHPGHDHAAAHERRAAFLDWHIVHGSAIAREPAMLLRFTSFATRPRLLFLLLATAACTQDPSTQAREGSPWDGRCGPTTDPCDRATNTWSVWRCDGGTCGCVTERCSWCMRATPIECGNGEAVCTVDGYRCPPATLPCGAATCDGNAEVCVEPGDAGADADAGVPSCKALPVTCLERDACRCLGAQAAAYCPKGSPATCSKQQGGARVTCGS